MGILILRKMAVLFMNLRYNFTSNLEIKSGE
jgi:hypothetical protein